MGVLVIAIPVYLRIVVGDTSVTNGGRGCIGGVVMLLRLLLIRWVVGIVMIVVLAISHCLNEREARWLRRIWVRLRSTVDNNKITFGISLANYTYLVHLLLTTSQGSVTMSFGDLKICYLSGTT